MTIATDQHDTLSAGKEVAAVEQLVGEAQRLEPAQVELRPAAPAVMAMTGDARDEPRKYKQVKRNKPADERHEEEALADAKVASDEEDLATEEQMLALYDADPVRTEQEFEVDVDSQDKMSAQLLPHCVPE
eukprot:COSAG01_NODE_5584_length_4164_cov_5.739483_3_plen_131_part_00